MVGGGWWVGRKLAERGKIGQNRNWPKEGALPAKGRDDHPRVGERALGVEADGVPSWRRLELAATFRDMGLSVSRRPEARACGHGRLVSTVSWTFFGWRAH